ncbi:2-iminoacetate synthase ThiH [Clostridium formicaceticum]|uniref:2-iminoacetate synthase n=1 Tax=Clostridium formicaceticum TaxID=1497 RepID=A0AAC9RRH5_9CLOT|nr:2-iminoacetate synthase ThiH [Clostridium formicaceticum]AOY75246.1 thiamine biosynthesis protein ThiH [Clostridium formicaceticum]ARE89680.1 2-iminoacetate synthase [Clostridium formicaceticum]
MSFENYCSQYMDFDFEGFFQEITKEDVYKVIHKNRISDYEFLALLSPAASDCLEEMAQKAHQLSLQHFGKAVLLYTPMYLGNYCVNRCSYCSYNIDNDIRRGKLTIEQIEEEAKSIAATGLKHILVLTGESKKETPVAYIMEAVKVLKKYFDSISIEIYPLTEEEYRQVIEVGVDGLTIYQETYDKEVYDRVHLSGPKKNYSFRLEAPERACRAKMRCVNIGALLGLNHWRKEAFFTGIHSSYLQNTYTDVEVSVSLPRIRPHEGSFEDISLVRDRDLVQIMLALKIFLPYVGITMSTRERREFRDHLIPLGVTKMSAGVSTEVGGHSDVSKGDSQFEISDTRSVEEVKRAILEKGYQPIYKNWMHL